MGGGHQNGCEQKNQSQSASITRRTDGGLLRGTGDVDLGYFQSRLQGGPLAEG